MRRSITISATLLALALSGQPSHAAQIDDCIGRGPGGQAETKSYPPGSELVNADYFLPAGSSTQFALKEAFRPDVRYFTRIESNFRGDDGKSFVSLNRNSIAAKQIPEDHPLVKKGYASKGDTLLTLNVPKEIGSDWSPGRLYVYWCDGVKGSPDNVSTLTAPVSPNWASAALAALCIIIVYIFAAVTAKAVDPALSSYPTEPRWFRYLDPVLMTAGFDGKGSLAKLQILFFSLIVFGLLAYIVFRTGLLSDLSATILTLLGIAAIGSATAKATDVQRNRLDFENWTWFIRKEWLPPAGLAAVNIARWRDIVSSDGEFDVYRFQSCIFSLVVGGALLSTGISELSTFSVPETLLGVLGLSQVVYVAGKLVSPPSFSDLNAATRTVRELERSFCDAAHATPDPSPPAGTSPTDPPPDLAAAIRRAGIDKYNAYMDAAKSLKIGFETVIGRPVAAQAVQPNCAA
jgi:hypothetical protein